MKNPKCVEAGKKASGVRWASRYEVLRELCKHYDQKQIGWFTEAWKTEQLIELLQAIKSIKK